MPRRSNAPAEPSAPRLPFSHMIVGSLKQRRDSGPFGGPRTKTRFGKRPKATGRNSAFVYARVRKTPLGKIAEILVALQPSIPFFTWVAQKGPFGSFLGRGGEGPIQKCQFGRNAKTAGGPKSAHVAYFSGGQTEKN